jgi:hypothetical protein
MSSHRSRAQPSQGEKRPVGLSKLPRTVLALGADEVAMLGEDAFRKLLSGKPLAEN